MHIVTCSNYYDSNRTVALRTGVYRKDWFCFANFHIISRVNCPFRLYKIFHSWINDINLPLVLELIMKTQKQMPFESINSIFCRCIGVFIHREERYTLCWILNVSWTVLCFHMPFTPKTCKPHIQNLLLLKKLFTSLDFALVDELSDQFNATRYYEMRKIFVTFLWKCQNYDSFLRAPVFYNSSVFVEWQ